MIEEKWLLNHLYRFIFFCGHMPSLVPPSLINEEDVRLCKAGRMQVIL